MADRMWVTSLIGGTRGLAGRPRPGSVPDPEAVDEDTTPLATSHRFLRHAARHRAVAGPALLARLANAPLTSPANDRRPPRRRARRRTGSRTPGATRPRPDRTLAARLRRREAPRPPPPRARGAPPPGGRVIGRDRPRDRRPATARSWLDVRP